VFGLASVFALLAYHKQIFGGPPASSKVQLTYYPNCAAARAAGNTPIYEGQPGYRPELDADSDGIACEPMPGHGH
jgi:hypothetical protein